MLLSAPHPIASVSPLAAGASTADRIPSVLSPRQGATGTAPSGVQGIGHEQGPANTKDAKQTEELRETFDAFVGETFFGQMISAMRKSVGKPAYFHGGRGEEIFQGQLDQTLSEKLAKSSAEKFSGPMFDLFMLQRG